MEIDGYKTFKITFLYTLIYTNSNYLISPRLSTNYYTNPYTLLNNMIITYVF